MVLDTKNSSDGTPTLYNNIYNEHYHSLKDGALSESYIKHIAPSFLAYKQLTKNREEVHILDICFGVGYNALLSAIVAKDFFSDRDVVIHSVEIDRDMLISLDSFEYPKCLHPLSKNINKLIEKRELEYENSKIKLEIGDAREYVKTFSKEIDIVFQDPFSPKKCSSLWSYGYFCDIFNALKESGILSTYSKATPVKMGLWMSGFYLYEIDFNSLKIDNAPFENLSTTTKSSLLALKSKSLYPIGKELLQSQKLTNSPDAKPIFD